MPHIYLSPSTQDWNTYVFGGSEEYYMNLLADALVPYLRANGIQFTRNTPGMIAGSSIRASNAGNFDIHLGLHSNAAPEGRYGTVRGSEVYYAPNSYRSQRGAAMMAERLKEIYPLANRVRAIPTTSIGEVSQTRAPAIFIEVAYHDNEDDALWIIDNIDRIAHAIALGLTDYFGTAFAVPVPPFTGIVTLAGGTLNLRSGPNVEAGVVGGIPNGARVTVYGQMDDWYGVLYGDTPGFVNTQFIRREG